MTRVLVIEDNRNLATGLRNNLEIEGYEVEVSGDGAVGLERARRSPPDLVILDLMLPKLDGFRVLKAIRQEALAMPVLILTARGEEADKVRGLKLGADDYVTKPFSLRELLARVQALLRRAAAGGPASDLPMEIAFGKVRIDCKALRGKRGSKPIELTPRELKVLSVLYRERGNAVSRASLLDEVWGVDYYGSTRTLDQIIVKLRQKLEEVPAEPRHLLTVHTLGYRLEV
jgi:DNA-binding response OmpR family regulator